MKRLLLGGLLLALLLAGIVVMRNGRGEAPIGEADAVPMPMPLSTALVAQGAYLARAGNCMGCHTARGGVPYAGGRGIATPFGTVFAPNLTPDDVTGLGRWSPAHFWRALHNGRSRDGHWLYPVFPYPNYTQITRADSDALYAYLRSLPPTLQTNRQHELQFPFDQQAALAVWRALYFEPAQPAAEPNRGAYLVEALGHCNACHSSRNALGASAGPLDLGGGLIPVQNWYAPSLASSREAGVATWDTAEIVALLKTGVSTHAVALGPMAEVVQGSTQHLTDADLAAMAAFLKALPPQATDAPARVREASAASLAHGAKLYEQHCSACHGEQGEGAVGVYPALAGNRAVTLDPVANLVHVVLDGGFPAATAGNPRPYGMPPFGGELGTDDVADLLSFIRTSWGNGAGAVSNVDVERYRSGR